MLELSAIGAELESRQEQLQRELDALKADARAQEATWTVLERRNVRKRVEGLVRTRPARITNHVSLLEARVGI